MTVGGRSRHTVVGDAYGSAVAEWRIMSDPSTAPTDRQVFLSFSIEDAALAKSVRRGLTKRGLSVWSADQDLSPGSRVASAIHEAIRDSDIMVILVTQASEGSPWVQFEAAAAIAEAEKDPAKWVIPVVVPPSDPPAGLLASYLWIQPSSADPEVVAAAVAEAADRVRPVDKQQERTSARLGLDLLARELEVEKRVAESVSAGRVVASRIAVVTALATSLVGGIAVVLLSWGSMEWPRFGAGLLSGVAVGLTGAAVAFYAGRAKGRK